MAGLAATFGSGAMTNSNRYVLESGCIFAVGSNTTEAHPVLGMNVKKAVRRGAKLIVANPRRIDLVQYADIWLKLKPGTNVTLLMAMAKVIVDEGLHDAEFIEKRCQNFEAFRECLDGYDLENAESITGVPREQIAAAARMYAQNSPASILYAMGITQFSNGTDNVISTADLAMLTGNVGKPGSGVNPLRGQNNVQGACDMGALPNVYPGYQKVTEATTRQKFEKAWSVKLSDKPGLTVTEMTGAMLEGRLKACYIVGENPVLSDPDASHVKEALNKLEFLVVQDIFLTETAELADVVLPAASFAEKNGSFTSTERRVQRVRKAIDPPGDSRADWLIICQVAQRMDAGGFDFTNTEQIMDEVASVTPSYGGICHTRIEEEGLQWPCPSREHPGTPILHCDEFACGKGKFVPLIQKLPAEMPDDEYPLVLTTGRSLYHFHTGTMTRKSEGLNEFKGEGEVEISPGDAERLEITDGDSVSVISRRGKVNARAVVTEASPCGVVFMNFHFAESPTNILTSPALDPVAKTPEYKYCAVKIEKV